MAAATTEENAPWAPMIAIALGQAIMSFNVTLLPVSLGGMAAGFGVSPTTIATGIVMCSLAVGAPGSARAAVGVAAFLIGGMLGTFIGWRPVFAILIAVSGLVFVLSFELKPSPKRPEAGIDLAGAVLAAASIILISFGFNNLNRWGLGAAGPGEIPADEGRPA